MTTHRRQAQPRVERRTVQLQNAEWRDPGEGSPDVATLRGYAAVFDRSSLPLYDFWFGEYTEEIDPAAFDRILGEDPDVNLVYVHDQASAMARTRSKTLDLTVDDRGLRVWAKLDPSDFDVQRIGPKMRRGDVDQMSFAFSVALDDDGEPRERWTFEGGTAQRRILEIGGLYDVSVVPQGAYPQTDAELDQRELRGLIREAREGKILSASSRAAIQTAVDALQELLDSAVTENGRAAAQRVKELRADMPSLLALTEMWEAGCDFIASETEPDDGPDRDAMAEVLATIETLIQGEANEDDPAEADSQATSSMYGGRSVNPGDRLNARTVNPVERKPVAPSDSADGDTASAVELLKLRTRARMATTD